jgi:hypothetical protein
MRVVHLYPLFLYNYIGIGSYYFGFCMYTLWPFKLNMRDQNLNFSSGRLGLWPGEVSLKVRKNREKFLSHSDTPVAIIHMGCLDVNDKYVYFLVSPKTLDTLMTCATSSFVITFSQCYFTYKNSYNGHWSLYCNCHCIKSWKNSCMFYQITTNLFIWFQ